MFAIEANTPTLENPTRPVGARETFIHRDHPKWDLLESERFANMAFDSMSNWVSTFIRVVGTFNPLTAALVQLQSELDSTALDERVKRLENPLRSLHPDLPDVVRVVYDALKASNDYSFKISDDSYKKYRRCFALLEQHNYLESAHRLGSLVPLNTRISNPHFLLYLCAMVEDRAKMDALLARTESAPQGSSLDGKAIAQDLSLPLPVVRAVFEIFAERGLGFCSREIGRVSYHASA